MNKNPKNPNLRCISFYGEDNEQLAERIEDWISNEGPLEIISCNYQITKPHPTSEYEQHYALILYKLL